MHGEKVLPLIYGKKPSLECTEVQMCFSEGVISLTYTEVWI